MSCILESLFNDGIMSEKLNNSQGEVRATRLLVSFLRLIETIIGTQPVGIREIDLAFKVRVLLRKHECFIPFMKLHMQAHKTFDVTKHQISLLSKCMMTSLSEILSAQFDFSFVLSLI